MVDDAPEGETVEFQCPQCGGLVRQSLRRFEAGVRDPECGPCRLQIKLRDEDRARILKEHNQWLLDMPRRSRTK